MKTKKKISDKIATIVIAIISLIWVAPILVVILNSFKKKAYIFKNPFGISSRPLSDGYEKWSRGISKCIAGLLNYSNALKKTEMLKCFGWSLLITVGSVVLIVLCTSMCAWYIARVKSKFCRILYYMFTFSMIVPFQMVMYTMTFVVNRMNFDNVIGILFVYLGFGAGLTVFMFTGFVKAIPLEVEEAATIDGCTPLQTYFRVVFPMLKPTAITVAILQAMWIWNDYLLPYLVLGSDHKTVPVAIQLAMQGAYGSTDYGGFMAMLVLAIIPIIIFYISSQKYIIRGVVAGAIK